MIRTINMTFEEKDFKKLANEKRLVSEKNQKKVSWEDFILFRILGVVL